MTTPTPPPAGPRRPPREPADPFGGRGPILLGVGAIVLVLALVTLFVVLADGDDDGEVPADDDTTTTTGADPSTSSTEADPTTSSTTTTTASTTTAPLPAEPQVVIADGYLLGWWDGLRWVAATDAEGELPPRPVEPGTTYRFVGLEEREVEAALGPIDHGCYLENNWGVQMDAADDRVGLPATSELRPRGIAEIPPQQEHVDDVAAWLADVGLAGGDVEIERVVRFDVEGDGVDEVLIEASHDERSGFADEPGAYSVLLYRFVDDREEVQTVVIAGDAISEDDLGDDVGGALVEYHDLVAIADLSGDGVFELVTHSGFYEGESVIVSTVDGPTVTPVLETGCGA